MPVTQTTLIAKADAWIQDDAGKLTHSTAGELGVCVNRSVERYSQDRPRTRYATLDGDGSTVEFATPTGWVDGFSRLTRVEHPYPPSTGQSQRNVLYDELAPNDPELVGIVRNASGTAKLVFHETPASGTANVLLAYTTPHTVHASDTAETTVPSTDVEALAVLVAAYACEMLAAKYAETNDTAIVVDSVDWRTKSGEWAARANQLRKQYELHVGAGETVKASSGFADWDVAMRGGHPRLFHRARQR